MLLVKRKRHTKCQTRGQKVVLAYRMARISLRASLEKYVAETAHLKRAQDMAVDRSTYDNQIETPG